MTNPHLEFTTSLIWDGPHPDIAPEHQIFAPFIGDWDLIVRWFDETGHISRQERGEWRFRWILEGRGIQDVWIVPPRSERSGRSDLYEYGTSVRFFDKDIGAWQSTWVGPMHRIVRTFVARKTGERVVLDTTEGVTPQMRWIFFNIEATTFEWSNEVWTGTDWHIQQTFGAKRV